MYCYQLKIATNTQQIRFRGRRWVYFLTFWAKVCVGHLREPTGGKRYLTAAQDGFGGGPCTSSR